LKQTVQFNLNLKINFFGVTYRAHKLTYFPNTTNNKLYSGADPDDSERGGGRNHWRARAKCISTCFLSTNMISLVTLICFFRCVSGFSSCGTFGPIRSLSSEGLGKTDKSQVLSCVTHWLRTYLLYLLVALLTGCATWLGINEHNSGTLLT